MSTHNKLNKTFKQLISATVLGLSVFSSNVFATENPINRPVTLVVGFSAGSVTDVLARKLAERLKDSLGQPVIVDNKPGAGATIAASSVARATPDGHTLLMTAIGHVLAPSVY